MSGDFLLDTGRVCVSVPRVLAVVDALPAPPSGFVAKSRIVKENYLRLQDDMHGKNIRILRLNHPENEEQMRRGVPLRLLVADKPEAESDEAHRPHASRMRHMFQRSGQYDVRDGPRGPGLPGRRNLVVTQHPPTKDSPPPERDWIWDATARVWREVTPTAKEAASPVRIAAWRDEQEAEKEAHDDYLRHIRDAIAAGSPTWEECCRRSDLLEHQVNSIFRGVEQERDLYPHRTVLDARGWRAVAAWAAAVLKRAE